MKNIVLSFVADDKGQDLIEYGLLIGIITVVCVATIKLIGPKVAKFYTDLNALLT